jgi:hypothetical protein
MRTAFILLLALALAAPAVAQRGDDRGRGGGGDGGVGVSVELVFGQSAEVEIRAYFREHRLEPQGLPPGIARNLARGKPLPPGIAKRYLPDDLIARLPAYPGCEIIVVDDDVLLVATATQIVLDILSGVL